MKRLLRRMLDETENELANGLTKIFLRNNDGTRALL